jgi:hypothetical protein
MAKTFLSSICPQPSDKSRYRRPTRRDAGAMLATGVVVLERLACQGQPPEESVAGSVARDPSSNALPLTVA